ncbi:MAG: EAL domain-containing protein, partial [Cyanothece sp. SIO1E1]|nr:EAL domain-containing protein [Cyanothece sp. SIO1E1]
QHPARGLVLPSEFIPMAEDTGLIIPIGRWVLYEACRQLRAWQTQFALLDPLKVNVNLSGKQLREKDFVDQLDQVLAETTLDSRCLDLEITESVLIDNPDAAAELFSQVRARNIHLSLDDFGTGYSSLSYLHRFPVNTLKIDHSFVSGLNPKSNHLNIIRGIVGLARSLEIEVVVEGVETNYHLTKLKHLGCKFGQGYFFAKPLDCISAEIWLTQGPQ